MYTNGFRKAYGFPLSTLTTATLTGPLEPGTKFIDLCISPDTKQAFLTAK